MRGQKSASINDFLTSNGLPRRLELQRVNSEVVAQHLKTKIVGDNQPIRWFSGIGPRMSSDSLVYLSDAMYADLLTGTNSTVITTANLLERLPDTCTGIVVDSDPKWYWGSLLPILKNQREKFPSLIHPTAYVHKSASIGDEVYIDSNTRIHENVVLRGPLYVGPNSVIGPGSVIGHDGFELTSIGGKRVSLTHLGGVWISSDVELHANNVIDKALDGGFTFVGSGSKIDTLVFIAHAAVIGKDCVIVACTEISGSSVIGDNVWLAPNCTVTNGVQIGSHSMIGTGAVVLRDVAENSVIIGHHKLLGFQCACGRRFTQADIGQQCQCGFLWDGPGLKPDE
jgi:UDP-3-O-[3-hydroxymyristoyl] glucosamine N-acyltransferase